MKRIICYITVMTRLKNVESERSSIEDGHISQWAEGRKMGAGGEKRRACHPPSAKLALSPSPSPTLFFCSTLFFPPPASYFRPTAHTGVCVCMDMCLSECVLEVRFGARAIKALLKHFWCCWLMLKLKEGEEREKEKKKRKKESEGVRGSETVREGVHTLSGYLGPPSGPLAACQYYEHRGARWVNNLILTSNFHGRQRGRAGRKDVGRDVCC